MGGKAWLGRMGVPAAALTLLAGNVFAAGGGGEAIVIVADSRRFSGLEAWSANLYNESHAYFALLTVLTIPLLGLLLGTLTGLLMRLLGINLKSRVLAEH
jgi:hypothetical protein